MEFALMKIVTNGVWAPADKPGEWHHFIVTRYRASRKDRVRVAYQRTNGEGQTSTDIDASVDAIAERNLSPDAIAAWRAQRAAGWDGTAVSTQENT
jgi:hypothetical protein